MVWYDFVILAILAYTAWQGAQRGLVTQVAWIAAIVLCFKFADKLAPSIEGQIDVEQPLKHWIAMFVLYLGFSLGSFMVARIMNSWLEKARFKDFDRHLGGILGLVKGIAISMVITFFALTLSDTLKGVVLASNSGKAACYILDTVSPITPEYFHEYLLKYQEELGDLHNEQLGAEGSIADFFPDSSAGPAEGGQGGGVNFPRIVDEIIGGDPTEGFENSDSRPETTQGPTFGQMLRSLPANLRGQFQNELQQKWTQSTPDQRQRLVDELGRSLGYDIPDILSGFLARSGSRNSPQDGISAAEQGRLDSLLNRIGDIYQRREFIAQRGKEHLAGLPLEIQRGVLEDWYADLSLQTDPDPATTVTTRIDDRILRQLDRARVSVGSLSLRLQERLNQSRR